MTRFYTADTHFNHRNILDYCNRPFDNVDVMNNVLIENINNMCREEDELWILGDYSLGMLPHALSLVGHILPSVHLVSGNHDPTHTMHKKNERATKKFFEAGFTSIQDEAVHEIANRRVILSHFPYNDDRFPEHAPRDDGDWLICGHVHELWAQNGRCINVGVDVRNYRPVSEEQIQEIMEGGPNFIDSIY